MRSPILSKLSGTKAFQRTRRLLRGNTYGISSIKSKKNLVNLEYSNKFNLNLGDALSPIIVNWMLEREGLSLGDAVASTRHIMAVGSIIDRGSFDTTVWGSGILSSHSKKVLRCQKGVRKFDIRAVRGPITREALIDAGFACPQSYGDPAVLLPMIYMPEVSNQKRDDAALVLHHASVVNTNAASISNLNLINISTADYKLFVDELLQSKKIISSSLHGIILAESYGIPAIYLWEDSAVGKQRVKFEDWYLSTGRTGVIPVTTIEEALAAEAPPLPDLANMQRGLMQCFPYDLWD